MHRITYLFTWLVVNAKIAFFITTKDRIEIDKVFYNILLFSTDTGWVLIFHVLFTTSLCWFDIPRCNSTAERTSKRKATLSKVRAHVCMLIYTCAGWMSVNHKLPYQYFLLFSRYLDREFLKAYSVVECRSDASLNIFSTAVLFCPFVVLLFKLYLW